MKKIRIGIISLGCPRNMVDSELMLGKLASHGYIITDKMDACDVAIINTCGFIEDAKREAIDIILKACDLKKEGRIKKVVVCGCLSQRYARTLRKEIPEADAILGVDNFKNVEEAVKSVLDDKSFYSVAPPEAIYTDKDPRLLLTPAHYAYVKIAEGCRNRCSYCVIYKIRGDLRSRRIESVLSEIKALSAKRKLSELNIIAQDTTSYGMDNYARAKLTSLLKKICALKRAHWVRLIYTHPRNFTDELIDLIAQEKSICKYIDLPIQHINDRILKRMNRRIKRRDIELLIDRIRKRIPSVAIRTSVIVGFPGETDKEFDELLAFIRDTAFERLGAFIYSREEGTPAYRFKNQLSDKIKRERFDRVMSLQQEISSRVNEGFMGQRLKVLIEEQDEGKRHFYLGRTQYDAPEVDGLVYVRSDKVLRPGTFADVKITDTLEYDLVGKAV
ncbi:MAG: 30S ribosomal protein S12 methylthiotransferase RimO [Candidatus Omnitrophica bacterium]|nr:30S ribosomal protein S12 methylthiotransferase RimO [Candidatus Omnitrophota bacterium]